MVRSAGVLPPVDFRVLGPVEVARDGKAVALGGAKRRALLALLLLHANEPVSDDRLIAALWGEHPPRTARNTLQVNVSYLRKVLGAERIRRDHEGYELRVEDGEFDLARFETAFGAARGAATAAERAARLTAALAEWRGEPLAGVGDERFAAAAAASLSELRLTALEERAEALLDAGGGAELIAELEALLAEHPVRERLYGHLMVALYRAGRQADALAVYQRARATLVGELGVEPSPELRRLEQAVLTQAVELEPQRVPGGSPLPATATTLVGREGELADLERLLEGGARLVTLTGPGGIGKTRLALELVRRAAARYADGAAWVPLTDVAEPESVARAVLQSLDLAAGADAEDVVSAQLRNQQLLLALDNFEHVVDAAPFVARLLERAPALVVVVTTRELLRLDGEIEFAVPPLGSAAAETLFVDRAGASVTREAANSSAIAEICARLEGLPLAIELAAARVRLLPPPALLARLNSRLDMLAGARRDAPERQRTMRGAIEWSYRLLEPDEQVLFARLGVFAGGASLEAAEAVCGDVATLERLGSLVDKSLLRQLGVEEPRFVMLETLREYAIEQLAAMGERDAVRARHVAYFAELVGRAEGALGGRDQRAWLDRLEADHANLRAAVTAALELGDRATAVATAGGLRMFWYVHGHADEGLRVLEALLADADDAPLIDLAKAHNGAAMLASDCGDYDAVRRHLVRALELARTLGDPQRIAVAQMNLGNVALFEEEWDEAEQLYLPALAAFRRLGSPRDEALVLEDLALVALGRGAVDAAVSMLEEAVERASEAEAPHEIGSARLELARALLVRGERERPRRLAAEAYDLFRTIDAPARRADCVDVFAGIAAAEGAATDAALLVGVADARRAAIGAVRQPDHERWLATVVGSHDAGRALDDVAAETLLARYRG